MAGKDRIAWGDGAFFNAGDVIFSAASVQADFLSDTLRDETAWMLTGFFPLGQFSFIEPVFMPPQPDYTAIGNPFAFSGTSEDTNAEAMSILDSSFGLRIQLKPGNIKMEAGYLYRGMDKVHAPYISFQGNLLVDWYLSVSGGIYDGDPSAEDALEDSYTITLGLLHVAKPTQDSSLSFRVEALIRPEGEWDAVSYTPGLDSVPDYGIQLFGEIVWAPRQTFTLYLRGVLSPLDTSALIIPGVNWNIYQGFSILGFFAIQAGANDALYAAKRAGGFTGIAGVSYIF